MLASWYLGPKTADSSSYHGSHQEKNLQSFFHESSFVLELCQFFSAVIITDFFRHSWFQRRREKRLSWFSDMVTRHSGSKILFGSTLTWWPRVKGFLDRALAFKANELDLNPVKSKMFFFTDSGGWGSLFQKLIFELQLQLTDNMFKKHKTQVTFGRYHADVGQCQLQTRQLTKPIWQSSRFEGFVKKSLILRFLIIRTYRKKIMASPKAHVNVL